MNHVAWNLNAHGQRKRNLSSDIFISFVLAGVCLRCGIRQCDSISAEKPRHCLELGSFVQNVTIKLRGQTSAFCLNTARKFKAGKYSWKVVNAFEKFMPVSKTFNLIVTAYPANERKHLKQPVWFFTNWMCRDVSGHLNLLQNKDVAVCFCSRIGHALYACQISWN